jgi:hypothetical protein
MPEPESTDISADALIFARDPVGVIDNDDVERALPRLCGTAPGAG